MSYIGNEPIVSATRTITEITATAGQTVFVANGGYTVGYIDVFVNGAQLQTSDFTATNGSSVTLNSPATIGDDIRLVAWGTFNTSNTLTAANPSYTGTLTGGTGVVNLGSGQFYKDASGNVGIGTSSAPSGGSLKLTVSNANGGGIQLNSTNAVAGGAINTSGGSGLVFYGYTGAIGSESYAERMRIDSSGNLLVGTTSVPSGAGSGSGRITATTLNLTDGIRSHQGSGGAFGGNAFNFYWTGSAQLWVDSTNIGNIATSSDYRIKRNIETQTESGIEKVLKLRPVTYQMADYGTMFKASDDIKEGFIAHEVQEVIPSGAEGVKDEENRIQNLKLDAILSVAVKAIQELKAELDATKAEVAALKAQP